MEVVESNENSYKIIKAMHPKNERKDLCIPGDYKQEKHKIKINDQEFDIDFEDKIFSLKNPVPPVVSDG